MKELNDDSTGTDDNNNKVNVKKDPKQLVQKTHYEILGVKETATQAEIKIAFHSLARRYHPDKQRQRQRQRQEHEHQQRQHNQHQKQQEEEEENKVKCQEDVESEEESYVQNDNSTMIIVDPTNHDENNDSHIKFRRIQLAWETLRQVDHRKVYDESLLQNRLSSRVKKNSIIYLSISSYYRQQQQQNQDNDENENEGDGTGQGLEQAVDDETGEILWVYDCRCGEELCWDDIGDTNNENNDSDDINNNNINNNENTTILECPGCCFVYQLVK